MKNTLTKNLKWILPLLVFIACLAVSVGVYYLYGQYNLDSDTSSEMVLAQLLNEEHRLVTDNWFYSTELRIISPVPVYQLSLALFPTNWHLARTVSICILLCIMSASLVYMVRGLGASYGAALLCAATLVLPLTEYNSFTLVYGGHYTINVALTFFEIGLVLRMNKRRIWEPLLLIVLSFLGGMNSVRMLMICVAPLLAACLVTFFLEARRCERIADFVKIPSFSILVGGLLCSAATFAGYWINTNILADIFSFASFEDTVLYPLIPEMLTDQIICLMSFFGYRDYIELLSLEGVVSMLAVILPVLGAACMILMLRMKLNAHERLLAVFMPIALLLGIVVNVLTSEPGAPLAYSVSYYMPAALLLIFAIFWALDRFECTQPILRVLPMLGLVAVFLMGNAVYRDRDLKTYNGDLESIADFLLKEDCKAGYATYWNANLLTELTNGQIEVYMVEDWESGKIGDWLQRADHMTKKPEGRVFAIYSADDFANELPGCDPYFLEYSTDKLFVCLYEDQAEFEDARGLYDE